MFNRNYVIFTAKIQCKIKEVKETIKAIREDRKVLKHIKRSIKAIACGSYHYLQYLSNSEVGKYILSHKSYFIKRGFSVEESGYRVTITW